MKIITLMLNPAFDLHCEAKDLRLYRENFVRVLTRDASGKGVNLSRALAAYGVPSLCLLAVGEENGHEYCAALAQDRLEHRAIFTPGRIRENFTFHEEGRDETRICFPGFFASPALLEQVAEAMGEVDKDTVITFTGSAPQGIDAAAARDFLESFRRKGAKIVIDSRLFTPEELVAMRPYLIKPNLEEAALYRGAELEGVADAADFAKDLHEKGVENAMVSLSGLGAVLCCKEGCFHAVGDPISVVSTIGAGDSTLAGFLSAAGEGLSPDLCLARAVAFGSAACMTQGSRPPKKEDILANLSTIRVQKLF